MAQIKWNNAWAVVIVKKKRQHTAETSTTGDMVKLNHAACIRKWKVKHEKKKKMSENKQLTVRKK